MTHESLEIVLNGKRYMISLDCLHDEVREKLKELSAQKIEPLTLLKLYITKAQEYALICQSLENLYKSLENVEMPTPHTSVEIHAIGNL
ncbi:hypothetical protein OQH61_07805 [Helicobacter sp. MIT 21-1697]|uniref:hypothetical protein n=1 Tax=Helicobacter sp. MIT 21-1697 TaxID=2993733 RepID=UPI00224AFD67|nr:hypothetical protein [Helicobacter sp. MIT 21-1697]MCX2717636.1 hypothetical protein [Helicobacter sp. MIT 21-1697]